MRAAREWRTLVRARLAEMNRLRPDGGGVGAAYWDAPGRARRFRTVVGTTADGDPLLERLRGAAHRGTTVLDVGAGTGRFSLALAPAVAEVTAVDPSQAMLGLLRRDARRLGLGNVRVVGGRWQDVSLVDDATATSGVAPADLVVCSYVLPLVEDALEFLRKLDLASRGTVYLYLNAMSADAIVDPFWRHFHGRPRRPAPTYLLAAAILRELGAAPLVEIVEVPVRSRFASLADAVGSYRDTLLLPDTAEVRAELRALLRPWLQRDGDRLRPPVASTPAAIVSWTATRRPVSAARRAPARDSRRAPRAAR